MIPHPFMIYLSTILCLPIIIIFLDEDVGLKDLKWRGFVVTLKRQ